MSDRTPVIAGVAESDLGVTGKTILQLQAQASGAALAECGPRTLLTYVKAAAGSIGLTPIETPPRLQEHGVES